MRNRLKYKHEITNYEEKSKILQDNGWETWYNPDNWIKTEWYDQGKKIDMMGRSTDDVYDSIVKKNSNKESLENVNIPVVIGSHINTEIYNCLNKLSNSVGEKITEYHWREFCDLMKMMEDEKMVEIKWNR